MASQLLQYMIAWRDSEEHLPRFFGPFGTQTAAEAFQRELPRPQPGGSMSIRTIENASHTFLPLIKDTIARARKHRLLNR